MHDKAAAYAFFVLFCALSAFRDVVSESYFKRDGASAIFVVFVYGLVTQVFALLIILLQRRTGALADIRAAAFRPEMFWLNLFTLTAFLFYFGAIETPLGAALNAFADYSVGPAATAAVAALLARERLNRLFFISAAASLLGIAVFTIPRWQEQELSNMLFVGVGFALLSALSGAM